MYRFGPRAARRPRPFAPRLDELGDRVVPAVVAAFTPANSTLIVFGDNRANTLTLSRAAAGRTLVNGGAVPVQGGTPTVANVKVIEVDGQGGNDRITLNQANGALPAARLFGGAGDDVLIGEGGTDVLNAAPGDDVAIE